MVMDGINRPSVPNGGGGGGGVAAVAVVDDDLGDGMQCTDHPYRNNTPGGICAFCLQEKLGKLVSTSSSFFIGSSSSSSPSFRSDVGSATSKSVTGFGGRNGSTTTNFGVAASTTTGTTSTLSLSIRPAVAAATSSVHENDGYESRRARIPFLLAQKKKKKLIPPPPSATTTNDSYHHRPSNNLVLKRSKSTATPRRGGHSSSSEGEDFSPHAKRSFWSFLHISKHSSATSTAAARRSDKITPRDLKSTSTPKRTSTIFVGAADNATTPAVSAPSSTYAGTGSVSAAATKRVECTVIDEADSPNSSSSNATSFGRKVSRSRSVGCGSRSFSGDFFERISTGFGDCTLRRVESQREGKRSSSSGNVRGGGGRDAIEERVRCGGIFSGFMLASSSSSSYWVSGSEDQANGKGLGAGVAGGRPLVHGRSKSSGWAFASPMRAFGSSNRPPSGNKNDGGVGGNKNANPTPNLAAIPSLLAVR